MEIKSEDLQKKKVLFFPDKIHGEDSGARSGRATLKSLVQIGLSVAVFSADADNVKSDYIGDVFKYYKINSTMTATSHFYDPSLLQNFKEILEEFKPDFFFTAGSIQKPAILAKEARKQGIKTIFLFYITDYYCAKVYAGLENGPCFKCLESGSYQALKNNCVKKPKLLNFVKRILVQKQLQKELLKSFKVVGYSDDQLDIYRKIGVLDTQCAKICFQFDPSELDNIQTKDGEYFLIIGQPTIEKGWHTISKILKNCKTAPKIKMIFNNLETEKIILKKFNLEQFVESGFIETNRGIVERKEILQLIANSRAILIPSYYPTTGEFVLLESLIMGKPVLVFEAGAHKNIIIHGKNGMIAAIGDFQKFAENIDAINSDGKLRQSLSLAAKKYTNFLFSDKARFGPLQNLFE